MVVVDYWSTVACVESECQKQVAMVFELDQTLISPYPMTKSDRPSCSEVKI